MNRTLPEMLQCNSDMTVFERQRGRLKWQHELLQQQQEQQHEEEEEQQSYFSELSGVFSSQTSHVQGSFQGGFMSGGETVMTQDVKPAWPELGKLEMASLGFDQPCQYGNNGLGFNMNYAISRTSSCPPTVAAAVATEAAEVKESSIVSEKTGSAVGRESFKKRKGDKLQNSKGVVVEDESNKRIKFKGHEEEGGESNITGPPNTNKSNNKMEASNDTSKENSKVSEAQKPDYIHVRARRGQATDSHSLAERVRREKISERMKYLQDLVPGCNKITGKAGMLDEIINYVQSLQRQVEFLSMKLAAVNPRFDFNIDNLFVKEEVFPSIGNGISSEIANPLYYLHFNPVQQVVSCGGLEMGVNPHEMALRRTISAPVPIPEAPILDSSCFAQIQPSATWDAELQNLYYVGI